MKKIKKNKQRTILELQLFNSRSYYTHFELRTFQRKYRKFFKFKIISVDLFCLSSKITYHTIQARFLGDNRYRVSYTKLNYTVEFTAWSCREFVEKLIQHEIY